MNGPSHLCARQGWVAVTLGPFTAVAARPLKRITAAVSDERALTPWRTSGVAVAAVSSQEISWHGFEFLQPLDIAWMRRISLPVSTVWH